MDDVILNARLDAIEKKLKLHKDDPPRGTRGPLSRPVADDRELPKADDGDDDDGDDESADDESADDAEPQRSPGARAGPKRKKPQHHTSKRRGRR